MHHRSWRIRREQERQQRQIEESLRATCASSRATAHAEDLITIRGERFVIPVRSELKRRIPGVIHAPVPQARPST